MANPSPFRRTSPFGERVLKGRHEFHVGTDDAAPVGTPVPATSSGEVIYSGPAAGFGHAVTVKSPVPDDPELRALYGDNYYITYGHVDPLTAPKPGTFLDAGDPVGSVGAVSGGELSTAPHVHQQLTTDKLLGELRRMNSGTSGGVGIVTHDRPLFQDPNTFTGWIDGQPLGNLSSRPNVRRAATPDLPVPYLNQTQSTQHSLDVMSWLQPGNWPNVLTPNEASAFVNSPAAPWAPAPRPVPYLDQMPAAQQARNNSSPIGMPPPGAPPWAQSDQFGTWNNVGGTSAPASGWGGRRSEASPQSIPAMPLPSLLYSPSSLTEMNPAPLAGNAGLFTAGAAPFGWAPPNALAFGRPDPAASQSFLPSSNSLDQSLSFDTAAWPYGPVGAPAARNPGGFDSNLDPDQSSPLDNAQWPFGPIGAPANRTEATPRPTLTTRVLLAKGIDPQTVQAATDDPALMQQLLRRYFSGGAQPLVDSAAG